MYRGKAVSSGKKSTIVSSGLYGFETIPFSLVNAPATFQGQVSKVLEILVSGVRLNNPVDIIVRGRSSDKHNKLVEKVFMRMRQTRLKPKTFVQRSGISGSLLYRMGFKPTWRRVKELPTGFHLHQQSSYAHFLGVFLLTEICGGLYDLLFSLTDSQLKDVSMITRM